MSTIISTNKKFSDPARSCSSDERLPSRNNQKTKKPTAPSGERARIHLDETEAHAERVAECLSMLDAKPSTFKSATGQVMEMAKGMMTKMASDKRVKDFLSAYGAEYFEVACYKALIAAARVAGAETIIPLLEKNLKEDEPMRNGST